MNRFLLPKIATSNWNPTWSPDGDYLYFTSNRGGSSNIWRARIEEETGTVLGTPERVTAGVAAGTFHPTVSRDGRSIAYAAVMMLRNIHKIHFDPEAESVVAEPVAVALKGGIHPSTSPDGQWLAFDDSFGTPESRNIGIIRTDGNDRKTGHTRPL